MIRLFLVRLGAVLAKEFVQMRRDRVTFAMMLGVPILQLILFGFAINTDPKRLDAALLATGQDHYSRAIVSALEVSDYYRFVARPKTDAEAEGLIQSGAVAFLVIIPSDFGVRVDRGDKPQILIEADATDPAAASNAIGALDQLASRALLREQGKERETASAPLSPVIPLSRSSSEASAQFKCTSPNARYKGISCSRTQFNKVLPDSSDGLSVTTEHVAKGNKVERGRPSWRMSGFVRPRQRLLT